MPFRVLIVDDHPVVRIGLRGLLEQAPDLQVVGEAANGVEAVAKALQLKPDVVLMDLRMPEMDGVEATRAIKAQAPEVAVLVLTTYDTDADILRAVEAGAQGYLLKDASPRELYEAIRAAARGETALAPRVATRLMSHLRQPQPKPLTEREREILTLVARGWSNKEIARHLHIGTATVKSHLLHIYEKLGVSDRTAAVTEALKRGWIFLE